MQPYKGDIVWDRITAQNAVVVSVTTNRDDGGQIKLYKLDGVPTSPNYPTEWRHEGEIERAHPE